MHADGQQQEIARSRNEQRELLDDFRRARRELPGTSAIAKDAEQVGKVAALLAHARTEVKDAEHHVDEARAEADAATRQLRHKAAERRMPTQEDEVDAIARAAAEFENAAVALHNEREKLARAEEDAAERTDELQRQINEHGQAEQEAEEAGRRQEALEEEFRSPHLIALDEAFVGIDERYKPDLGLG